MRLVVFGLSISSSFGNGHATLWRGLARALAESGGSLVFFERDVEWYASHRDGWALPGVELVLYADFADVRARAEREARAADATIVTSYCPDGRAATEVALHHGRRTAFYDLDTPVTLARLARGEAVEWLGPEGLAGFDVVFSYSGGRSLADLGGRLHAKRVMPLYGHADPETHQPAPPEARYGADLAYLGTYAADRQDGLERLFIGPARARPEQRFLVGGAMYPADIAWPGNVARLDHVAPPDHPAFYASSRAQLNLTRADMIATGWCPSGRLFEAAACGAAIVSDAWDGLDAFFVPGEEILVARTQADVEEFLDLPDAVLRRIGAAARERVLTEHTSTHRLAVLTSGLSGLPEAGTIPELAEG